MNVDEHIVVNKKEFKPFYLVLDMEPYYCYNIDTAYKRFMCWGRRENCGFWYKDFSNALKISEEQYVLLCKCMNQLEELLCAKFKKALDNAKLKSHCFNIWKTHPYFGEEGEK